MILEQPKTYSLIHIWHAFAEQMLKNNPDYYSKRKPNGTYSDIKYYYIYKKIPGKKREEIYSYPKFRKVVEGFFVKAKKAIMIGESVSIYKCGRIFGKRVQRDFRSSKRPIDWVKTMMREPVWDEAAQKMKRKAVKHSSDDYVRIAWEKSKGKRVKNMKYYKFCPSSPSSNGQGGFRREFSQANVANPLLKYNYIFEPIKVRKRKEKIA